MIEFIRFSNVNIQTDWAMTNLILAEERSSGIGVESNIKQVAVVTFSGSQHSQN